MACDPSRLVRNAARLCAAAGVPGEFEIAPLQGGCNNRVYRLESGAGSFLLKEYFRHPGDRRDRLGAEFGFSRFAWGEGVRCLPEPIACDQVAGLALYRFVAGAPIAAGELTASDVEQAAAFARALHDKSHTVGAAQLPDASEACFSIAGHLQLVYSRLARLAGIPALSELDREARQFVTAELTSSFASTASALEAALAKGRISAFDQLAPAERTVSPSDFGFHNALRRPDGTLVFLDFEYAGWDDPAKLACDFFCQVAVPVPLVYYSPFTQSLARGAERGALLERIRLLMPLYRLKWCCIALNHFLPVDAARRRFAGEDAANRKRAQLVIARERLKPAAEFDTLFP